MKHKSIRWTLTVTLVLALAPVALAVVSVDEIIRLHQAGLSDPSLLLVVANSDTPDTLSTAQLTELINAGVPDTVITELVSKADVVMEDWQPVDVDAELQGREIYTTTEVYNVYPSYGGWWGWGYPDYGWCATPYYCASPYYYDPWYSGFYIGFGSGGWYAGIGFGWGWGGYYPYYPYYSHYPYYPYYGYGGWCGYYPYPSPYYGYSYARYVERPNYRGGVYRDVVRGGDRAYRADGGKTLTDTRLAAFDRDRRVTSTVDRAKIGDGRYALRGEVDDVTAGKSNQNLRSVATDPGTRTLDKATRGDGRHVLRSEDRETGTTRGSQNGEDLKRLTQRKTQKTAADYVRDVQQRQVTKQGEEASGGRTKQVKTGDVLRAPDRSTKTRTAGQMETLDRRIQRYVNLKKAQQNDRSSSTRSATSNRATASSGSKTARRVSAAPTESKSGARATTPPPKSSRPSAPSVRSSSPSRVSGGGIRSGGTVSRGGGAVRTGGGASRSGGRR